MAALSLQRDLGVSDAALQLIVGGYAFMCASGMVTGGRLGRCQRGRERPPARPPAMSPAPSLARERVTSAAD